MFNAPIPCHCGVFQSRGVIITISSNYTSSLNQITPKHVNPNYYSFRKRTSLIRNAPKNQTMNFAKTLVQG
jgi:hypothetical protein